MSIQECMEAADKRCIWQMQKVEINGYSGDISGNG